MNKVKEMLLKLDVACSVLQGRCESLDSASYQKDFDEAKALAILRASYTFLMEANNYMVAYLDDLYSEKKDDNNIDCSGDDSKSCMVPNTRLFDRNPPRNKTVRGVNAKRNSNGV